MYTKPKSLKISPWCQIHKNFGMFFHLGVHLLMLDLVQFAAELAEFLVQAFVFGLEQVFEERVLPLHAFGRRRDFLADLSLRLFTQVLQDV